MTVKELIEHLQKHYQPDDEVAYSIWTAEDIDFYDEDNDLSPEEKDEVIRQVDHYKTGTDGITWDTLKWAIGEVLLERDA